MKHAAQTGVEPQTAHLPKCHRAGATRSKHANLGADEVLGEKGPDRADQAHDGEEGEEDPGGEALA